jgi:S-formylglutathione hydrolase FrmB
MPQVHRSFYADEVYGGRYWTFLTAELPGLVASFFNVSQRREDTFVAGLSMGGYGALKWALREPDRFAAAASLSGAAEISRLRRERAEDPRMMQRIFGDAPTEGSDDDVLALVDRSDPTATPPLYVCCGTEDELIGGNRELARRCQRRKLPITTDFGPGEHDWAYWDDHIQDVLSWLPLRAPSNG